MKSIYLAGPIFGCTEGEAKDWRKYVADRLPPGIVGVSPLRCEPLIGTRYDVGYNDPCFGAPKAILAKNFLDLRACDMTLAYFPHDKETAELLAAVTAAIDEQAREDDNPKAAAELAELAKSVRRIATKSPQRSIGTIGEISWAYALRKPCVIVSDDPLIRSHPFTKEQPDWPVLDTLDDALRLINGIFGAYTGGKNV